MIKLLLTRINLQAKNKDNKTAIEYLDSEELKQFAMDCAKPKQKEPKVAIEKKPEEEEIDDFVDDFLEESSPTSKRLGNIAEESDDDRREDKKEKAILKAKKNSSNATGTKQKELMKPAVKSSSNQKLIESK